MAEFADTLKDLVSLYRETLLLPNARAVDPTLGGYGTNIDKGSGGHGTHGPRGTIPSFGDDAPLSVRLAWWLERAVAHWRFELERERDGVERAALPPELVELAAALNGVASTRHAETARKGGKPGASKRAEDRHLLATKGDAIVVGLLFGRTSEAVRKLRERAGQDPHTGERLPRVAPLTSRELPADEVT